MDNHKLMQPQAQSSTSALAASAPAVTDVYGDQIEVDGKWFHAQRIFGRPATSFAVGDLVAELAQPLNTKKAPEPDEYVDSDLFRESGANVSHTPEKIAQYAAAMAEYGGWGKFPMVAGRVVTIDAGDVERYEELDAKGIAWELAYSRPLTRADIGRRIVHLENGHNRSYAAARHGYKIPTYDMELDEQSFAKPPAPTLAARSLKDLSL
jgi:hypothetical protein